jgi:hypothetical protein
MGPENCNADDTVTSIDLPTKPPEIVFITAEGLYYAQPLFFQPHPFYGRAGLESYEERVARGAA